MSRILSAATAILAGLSAGTALAKPVLTTLYTFTGGADGGSPTNLVPGKLGSFYGTGGSGGATGNGTVFQLKPPASGNTAWTVAPLYSFAGGADGTTPYNLVADTSGNLFGTTLYGGGSNANKCGSTGCGSVFELSPPAAGQTQWTKTTLHSFTGDSDGRLPWGVAFDSAGNLYGFTYGGSGSCTYNGATIGCGTIYRLMPPVSGQTTWKYGLLYTFKSAADGNGPAGVPLIDSAGAIYGTTGAGGPGMPAACLPSIGCSVVFKLTPPPAGKKAWARSTLFAFDGTNGTAGPTSLIADGAGNLFGTTNEGGTDTTDCPANDTYGFPAGCGTAFELSPPASGSTKWMLTEIWSFDTGADGEFPYNTGLTADHSGYYSTSSGGYPFTNTFGSIIKFTPPAAGSSSWTEKTVFTFANDANGAGPAGSLLLRGGYLYGTTSGYGSGGAPYGTVFRVLP